VTAFGRWAGKDNLWNFLVKSKLLESA